MAKWGYLARAYAIAEYAYMRSNEGNDPNADSIQQVTSDIKYILGMAKDSYISAKETPYEYRTIKQCNQWLKDFQQRREVKQ